MSQENENLISGSVVPPSVPDEAGFDVTQSFHDANGVRSFNIERTPEGHTIVRDANPNVVASYDEERDYFTVDPRVNRPIPMSSDGMSAIPPQTVYQLFEAAVRFQGDKPALRVERGGEWRTWTWQEFYNQSVQFGAACISIGMQPFESVNIIGFNSPEWHIANMGAIAAGGMSAGIYATNKPDACKYIVDHSGGVVVVCENRMQIDKFVSGGGAEGTNVKALVMWSEDDELPESEGIDLYKWSDFMALATPETEEEVKSRIAAQEVGQCCTLIYTSGTTGNPKAVMISHDNCTWTATVLSHGGLMPGNPPVEDMHVVSYLPLSHIAAQICDIHLPIRIASLGTVNHTIHFARPDALKGTLGETLRAVRPTYFFGVPRVWEKIAAKVKAKGAQNSWLVRKLSGWAKGRSGWEYKMNQVNDVKSSPFGFGLASKLLHKARVALGLDRCKACMTGAAPIQKETLEYWGSLNIKVLELYGMSESTGPQTVSFPGMYKIGSCGATMPGAETMLYHEASRDKEGEGEICFRGRHIMLGYMNNADKTRSTIDADGWLHSGDVGRLDEHGMLSITGRIKELIIGAGGENIAPVPAEQFLKKIMPALSNVMMVGDQKKYNVCLVSLKSLPKPDGTFEDNLAPEALAIPGISSATVTDATNDEAVSAYIQNGLDQYNNGENGSPLVSRAAKIQYFRIVPTDFSVPGGELGPTLKLRRPIVNEHYAELIESMYQS